MEELSSIIPMIGIDTNQLQGTTFTCSICSDRFTNKQKIAMHYVLNHSLEYCSICMTIFSSTKDRNVHVSVNHYPLLCGHCNMDFLNNDVLDQHYLTEHSANVCLYCPTLIQPLEMYNAHVSKRHVVANDEALIKLDEIFEIQSDSSMYKCFLCLKVKKVNEIFGHYVFYHNFSVNKILDYCCRHSEFIQIHGATSQAINDSNKNCGVKMEQDVCSCCKSDFTVEIPKEFHDIFCKGNLSCPECDDIFPNVKELTEHTTNHSCKFGCEEKMIYSVSLDHMKSAHDIVSCILCGMITSSSSDLLKTHLKEKHFVDLEIYEKCEENTGFFHQRGARSKKVFCNFCNFDLTKTINDLPELISHYAEGHFGVTNIFMKKIDKNPFIQKKRKIESVDDFKSNEEYLNNFTSSATPENVDYKVFSEKSVSEFDAKFVYCIASDTSDGDSSGDETRNDLSNDEDETVNTSINKPPVVKSKYNRYSCEFCGFRVQSIRTLGTHMKGVHGFEPKNFEIRCSLCKINFSNPHCLVRHNKRKHVVSENGKTDLQCPFCVLELESKVLLRKHIKSHMLEISGTACTLESIGYRCRFCLYLFWTPNQRNKHQIEQHPVENDDILMNCNVCSVFFTSKTCFRRHYTESHPLEQKPGSVIFKCSICKVTYPELKSVEQHMNNIHPDVKSFYCRDKLCKLRIDSNLDLEKHFIESHSKIQDKGVKNLQCNSCEKNFKSDILAINHFKKNHESKKAKVRGFKCKLCEKEFRTYDDRKLHGLTDHVGQKMYPCTMCDKGFNNKSGLYAHVQVHSKLLKTCTYCGKTFTRQDSFSEHLLIHLGPQHKCNYCVKTFVQRSNLVRHERIHTGEKPYCCKYCEKTFSDRGACTSHEKVHTREEVSCCPYCNKSFSKKQKLRYHIRLHTLENLQNCDVCKKAFTNSHSLKLHRATHEKSNTIPCEMCDKMFSNERYLRRHMIGVHFKPEGTPCPICGRKFTIKTQLREHIMTHGSGKHVLCILCDFKCSNQKAGRKHLKKVHDIDKDQTPLRQYLHIKTPEEDGIIFPAIVNSEIVPVNIKQEITENKDEDEEEDDDDYDDETDDEDSDETNFMGNLLQPEVIIGSQ